MAKKKPTKVSRHKRKSRKSQGKHNVKEHIRHFPKEMMDYEYRMDDAMQSSYSKDIDKDLEQDSLGWFILPEPIKIEIGNGENVKANKIQNTWEGLAFKDFNEKYLDFGKVVITDTGSIIDDLREIVSDKNIELILNGEINEKER